MSEIWWADPAWCAALAVIGVTDFASAWSHCTAPTDGLNHRDPGWAAVHRIALPGEKPAVFLKQQQDYQTRSLRHPFGEPVAARELRNLRAFEADRLPVPQVVCYGVRRLHGHVDTLLGIADLQEYAELDFALDRVESEPLQRSAIIQAAGALVGKLHAKRWEYRCLYPKHIFVRRDADAVYRPCFIDLEKARRRLRAGYGALRDLTTFVNRCPDWNEADWTTFFQGYYSDEYSDARRDGMLNRVRARRARRS